jgi:two-component system cell cycle sensor histidine kinase/response regulator CckA
MSAIVELVQKPEERKLEIPVLLENSPFGLAICNRQGKVISLNAMFRRLIGFGRNDRLQDLVHSSDRSETENYISELFMGRRESFQIDASPIAEDRRALRWTVWRALPEGAADCMVVMLEDLPSLAAAEQRLRQADRLEAVGRLAGGVAHDFNNLLTGILLYCDLLMVGLEPCHRVRKYAEEIRKAGMQATGLVRQLLAIARPKGSQSRPVSLNEIAESMRNLLVRLIGENIELKLRLDPNLGLVNIDPVNAQQVLLNLVLNARDAMPAGGLISVETGNCKVQVLPENGVGSTRTDLPCALFAVRDNGTGMDAATRSHLFEPFFTTKGNKGNGIGLATVHDIVTTSGGLIYVDSELGHGSRISVLLPLVPDSTPPTHDFICSHSARNAEALSSIEED